MLFIDTVKKTKRQAPTAKYSQYTLIYLTKDFYLEYIKNCYSSRIKEHMKNKKSHNPIFKTTKDLTRCYKRKHMKGQ